MVTVMIIHVIFSAACRVCHVCGVCILWEWEWIDYDTMDLFDSPGDNVDTNDDSDKESVVSLCDESCGSGETEQVSSFHTVTFKCIGATRNVESQDSLKCVNQLLTDEVVVPVNIL